MVWSRKIWNKSSYKVNKESIIVMKRLFFRIFWILYVLFGWQSVQAQSTVLSSQMPAGIEKTIIQELKYPMSISYVETLTEHRFVLYDGTNNPLSLIRIDANIFVNDFVIEDDTVFFCGRNSLNNQGVFGHFHINYFYNATYSYS